MRLSHIKPFDTPENGGNGIPSDKYSLHEDSKSEDEENNGQVDNEAIAGPDYVPMVKPGKSGKGKKHEPTTDKAENSLINTLWFYNQSDAS